MDEHTPDDMVQTLTDTANAMLEGENRELAELLTELRDRFQLPCNDEELAALALVVLQTEGGLLIARAGDLMALLSRKSLVCPRWDLVLAALSKKHLIALLDDKGRRIAADSRIERACKGNGMRELRVGLLLPGSTAMQPHGYASNREYLEDCFTCIEHFLDERGQQRGRRREERQDRPSTDLSTMKHRIHRLAHVAAVPLPLEELCRSEGLDERDWLILVHVLWKRMTGEEPEVKDMVPHFGTAALDRYDAQKYFEGGGRPVARGILRLKGSCNIMRRDIVLDPWTVSLLIEGDTQSCGGTEAASQPFASNAEFLEAWIAFGDGLFKTGQLRSLPRPHADVPPKEISAVTLPAYTLLQRRIAATGSVYPLERLMREHGLDDNERIIAGVALAAGLRGRPVDIPEMVPLLSCSLLCAWSLRGLFRDDGPLIRGGFITVAHRGFGAPDFIMPARMIESAVDAPQEESPAEALVRGSELLTLLPARRTLDELQLPAGQMRRLRDAVQAMDTGALDRLRNWGADRVTAGRSASSLLLLFSGAPGTGKTFAAEALAGSLGRSLLVTDISRLLSCWFGESQHNVTSLFREYRRICEKTETPPVLLLNEADQFLMRRMEGSGHGGERTFNQMQNLFLENLETFPGILIATTNLTSALDEAFSRRFDAKIVFPRPDASLRLRLWEAHIPAGVPRETGIDLMLLASRYAFSGGQIAVAAANAIRAAAIRGDELRMGDLIAACEEEATGCFEERKSEHAIGFRQLRD